MLPTVQPQLSRAKLGRNISTFTTHYSRIMAQQQVRRKKKRM
jgi:hypothetical protein